MVLARQAYELAESLLAEPLPRRWAHTCGVAARAELLAAIVGDEADALREAAILHDIGYSPALALTGFHPLDGARHLRAIGTFDELVVRLVANHSFALVEAEERRLHEVLQAEFPRLGDQLMTDALVYCDMTTSPGGTLVTPGSRLKEIRQCYGLDSVVGRFIRRVEPAIHRSVARITAQATASGLDL